MVGKGDPSTVSSTDNSFRRSTDAMKIKPTTASPIPTVNQRQIHTLKTRAAGTRHQLEIHMHKTRATGTRHPLGTHMCKRVAPHTHSKRLHRADMEVKRNNKLPTAVGTDKGRTWAMEVMVSSRMLIQHQWR